ncbi:MAG: helix-turn-helix transcriptional regulator [Clostridia bacterium]|nr:helix-turn-helix transcriptional regulator [Clostridia bacterium]
MTDETNFKKNFGNKLNTLRKQRGMTQSELGYQLNYSDKAISKWERGESVPDSYTVYKIAELFGVSVDEMLSPGKELDLKEVKPTADGLKPSRLFVPIITAVSVFFIASVIFLVMKNVDSWSAYAHFAFLYAVPAAAIVLTIFSSLWWRMVYRCIFVSLIIWTSAFAVYFSFNIENLKYIFIPCAILQVACILAYVFAYFVVKKK